MESFFEVVRFSFFSATILFSSAATAAGEHGGAHRIRPALRGQTIRLSDCVIVCIGEKHFTKFLTRIRPRLGHKLEAGPGKNKPTTVALEVDATY